MRIILPSALLVAGTVALLGSTSVFGSTSSDAAVKGATPAPQVDQQTSPQPPDADRQASSQPAQADKQASTQPPQAAADKEQASASPKHSQGFSFALADVPLQPEDPQEKIDKARPLHEQAMELFKDNQLDKAIALERQASEIAPNYWLPHAGLAYLLSNQKHKSPFEALREASAAIKTRHPAVADRNLAKLFLAMHMFQPAELEYTRAIKAEPDCWLNYVGLVDCQLIGGKSSSAEKTLNSIPDSSLKDFDCLAAVSARYLEIPNYVKAKELLARAIEVAPNQANKQDAIDLFYSTAVKSDDVAIMTKLQSQISEEFKKEDPALVFAGKTRLSGSPADVDGVLADAAALQVAKPEQVFYAIGIEVLKKAKENTAQRQQWLTKADQAFKNALSRKNTDLKYQLAVASIADQRNDATGLTKALQDIKDSISPATTDTLKLETIDPQQIPQAVEDFQKLNLIDAYVLRKADSTEGSIYQSAARDLQIKLLKPSCSCHVRALQSAMNQQPGAILATATHDQQPIVSIVYDSRKNSSGKLLASQIMKSLKEPFEQLGDKPLNTVADLDDLLIAHDQKPAKAPPFKATLDLPLEAAGQVAGTAAPSVR